MKIVKKEKTVYFFLGITFVFGGLALLLYFIDTRGAAGDFITVFGKLASIVVVIVGIGYFVLYGRFYQNKNVAISIEDGVLRFEDKSYLLDGSFLTLQMKTTPKKDMYQVTLFLEKNNKSQKIFERIVFNLNEMQEFLKLIKPYRKTKVCLVDEKPYKIQLFDGGFTYEGREILYDEVQSFDTVFIDTKGIPYLDIEIVLKNGDKIETRLNNGIKEYARAKYASLICQNGGKKFSPIACSKNYLGTIIFGADVIAMGLNYLFDWEVVRVFGVIMVIVTFFYVLISVPAIDELCEEVRQIQQEMDCNENY